MSEYGEITVHEPMRELIERKAFFMWCDQGKPDGEEIVDFGLGEKKLCEYHWILASIEAEMESWNAIRKMGPITHTLGPGYFYCPYVPITPPMDEIIEQNKKVWERAEIDKDEATGEWKVAGDSSEIVTIEPTIRYDDFKTPKKGIITKYGRKLLKEGKAKFAPVDEPACDELKISLPLVRRDYPKL